MPRLQCILRLLSLTTAALFCLPAEAAESGEAAPAVIRAAEYENLQAAFDAVPAGGGLVILPPGRFLIEQPLVLSRSETRVVGAGAATCLVNTNQKGQPTLIVRPAEIEKNPRARLWRVQLADFRICGDPNAIDAKSTEPKSGDGLLAHGVNELFVHGLSIDHHGGNGIRMVACYEDARVSNSIVTYNRQAGLAIEECHDIVVNANQLEENQDALRCIDSFNLCMNGNNLDDHLGNGVVIENTYGSVVSGNMIEECAGIAIILDRDCYGITLSANVIAHDMGGGVDLRDAWGCAVSANTFTLDDQFGVKVGPQAGRIPITGNAFCDSHLGGAARRLQEGNFGGGIILEGTSDIVISGNTFTGLSRDVVNADAKCQRIVFQGNLVFGANPLAEGGQAKVKLDAAKDVVTQGNLVATDPAAKKPE
ncbi:MAG: right-handed parallel beta-helix repeat-containing protein [Planctomycetaceae bacterium]|nr:right-handed parallel beta-helix repeat-containing protein [Planctomycetaceae bacterium]